MNQALKVQDALLRQQLTLQVFSPIGLRVLKEYEGYDPMQKTNALNGKTFGELLEDVEHAYRKCVGLY